MNQQFGPLLYTISVWALPAIVAITFNEAEHGFVARLLGDDTAWRLGRVTFNPLKHIDPVGTILLPGLTAFSAFAPSVRLRESWALAIACQSAWKIGSDSLLMKFADGVALIWRENQRHASTSAAVLTGAQRLRRGDGGP
jgi:hypothetical protein